MLPHTTAISSQEALDRHVADTPDRYIRAIKITDATAEIMLPKGTWYVYGSGTVHASAGNVHTNHVRAVLTGNAYGRAYGRSTVIASGTCRVEARERAHVKASGEACVELLDKSTGELYDCTQAYLDDTAKTVAYNLARVICSATSAATLYDAAQGVFYGRSQFHAYGSSLAVADGPVVGEASGTATVVVHGQANVDVLEEATAYVRSRGFVRSLGTGRVMVRNFGTAIIEGGAPAIVEADSYVLANGCPRSRIVDAVIIGDRPLESAGVRYTQPSGRTSPEQWLRAYCEEDPDGGGFIVYKALGTDLVSGAVYRRPLTWPLVGGVVLNDVWEPTDKAGHGLHLSPTPSFSRYFLKSTGERVLRCSVLPEDVSVLNSVAPQIKARKVRVLGEVPMKEWF